MCRSIVMFYTQHNILLLQDKANIIFWNFESSVKMFDHNICSSGVYTEASHWLMHAHMHKTITDTPHTHMNIHLRLRITYTEHTGTWQSTTNCKQLCTDKVSHVRATAASESSLQEMKQRRGQYFDELLFGMEKDFGVKNICSEVMQSATCANTEVTQPVWVTIRSERVQPSE